MINKSIRLWTIAYAVALPIAAILGVAAIAFGDWAIGQPWFKNPF